MHGEQFPKLSTPDRENILQSMHRFASYSHAKQFKIVHGTHVAALDTPVCEFNLHFVHFVLSIWHC